MELKIQTPEELKTIEDFDDWYIIQVQTNMENKIKQYIDAIDSKHIKEVIIPIEKIIENKEGKEVIKNKRLFPGYILVKIDKDLETFNEIKRIPRVQGFLQKSPDNTPIKMSEREAKTTFKKISVISGEGPKASNQFNVEDIVRVNDGPFKDFEGVIKKVDIPKSQYKVEVKVFGREVEVDLSFKDVSSL